jgi:hypothetical protein
VKLPRTDATIAKPNCVAMPPSDMDPLVADVACSLVDIAETLQEARKLCFRLDTKAKEKQSKTKASVSCSSARRGYRYSTHDSSVPRQAFNNLYYSINLS